MASTASRVAYVIFGVSLIGAVVWWFFETQRADPGVYLLLYGLGSAILVPLGIWFIAYGIRAKREDAMRDLARVPQIDSLIQQARTQEEKIALLKSEYALLETRVQMESERLALRHRKADLDATADRLLDEMRLVEQELARLGESTGESRAAATVELMQRRLNARQQSALALNAAGFGMAIASPVHVLANAMEVVAQSINQLLAPRRKL